MNIILFLVDEMKKRPQMQVGRHMPTSMFWKNDTDFDQPLFDLLC